MLWSRLHKALHVTRHLVLAPPAIYLCIWCLLFGLLPLSPELANSSVYVHCCSSCSWTIPTCSRDQ